MEASATITPVKCNVSGIDNISPEPTVLDVSSISDTPASAVRHLYSEPGASTSSGSNQTFYPVAVLPEFSLSEVDPTSDQKSSTENSTVNAEVFYDDLLVPYCKLCLNYATSEIEKKHGCCKLCNTCVAYLCSQCHGITETYDQGVAHLNNLHHVYQKITCPICGYESYDMFSMSNHMILHDRNHNLSDED